MNAARVTALNLPGHILEDVFKLSGSRKALIDIMLVHSSWYEIAESLQYSDLVLNFTWGDNRPSRCLETLKIRCNAARAARHLTISGLSTSEARDLLLAALAKTTGLVSLDLQLGDHVLPSKATQELYEDSDGFQAARAFIDSFWSAAQAQLTRSSFLPRLEALRTNDVRLIHYLAPERPLDAVGLLEDVKTHDYEIVASSLLKSTSRILQLRLDLVVDNLETAADILRSIAQTFPTTRTLVIVFRLPSARGLEFINQICPILALLSCLEVLSLALMPNPILPSCDYEAKTKELAQLIVNSNPLLTRVDVRWHGWTVFNGALSRKSIAYSDLLRQPTRWSYSDTRPKSPFHYHTVFDPLA
ncbi:hypothetical protein WOLCODRAFT_164611 [Wolfiporia cocos MD-104 SS10]|uniref:F-box domain-containing protein n=1 Tax=Wolfiporia cocos (strain MD-104) TaxID=742152 RepID=A0A2H3JN86_WOLCO|nr:hypothetical protein WOLCODRAFT_164611 [Wolfiporia cocos MD-104 SS10]